MGTAPRAPFSTFRIGFDERDRPRLHELWDEVITSQQWTEGEMTRRFEAAWADWNGLGSVALSGWTGGAPAAPGFARVRGGTVLWPSHTVIAAPPAAGHPGAQGGVVGFN